MTADEEQALCTQCEDNFVRELKIVLDSTQDALSDIRLKQIIFTAFTTSLLKSFVIMTCDLATNPNKEKLRALESAKKLIEDEIDSLKKQVGNKLH